MVNEKKEIDYEYTHFPTCPFCGYEDIDWWDGTTLNSDGDHEVYECGNCCEKFTVRISISTDFTSEFIKYHESKEKCCSRCEEYVAKHDMCQNRLFTRDEETDAGGRPEPGWDWPKDKDSQGCSEWSLSHVIRFKQQIERMEKMEKEEGVKNV